MEPGYHFLPPPPINTYGYIISLFTFTFTRFVQEGLSVQPGDAVLVVEYDLFHGWARCIPLRDSVNYRRSGWLPATLLD